MNIKADKSRPGDKKSDRRFQNYVYRNAEYYHNYKVFDDGRIDMHWWVGSLRAIVQNANALNAMYDQFANFYFKRVQEHEKMREDFWVRVAKDLSILDPTYDKTKFTYGIDLETGYLTKTPVKEEKENDRWTP